MVLQRCVPHDSEGARGEDKLWTPNFRREWSMLKTMANSLRGVRDDEDVFGARALRRSKVLAHRSLPNQAASKSVKYSPLTAPRRTLRSDGAARSLMTIRLIAIVRHQPALVLLRPIFGQLPPQRAASPPVGAAVPQGSPPPLAMVEGEVSRRATAWYPANRRGEIRDRVCPARRLVSRPPSSTSTRRLLQPPP